MFSRKFERRIYVAVGTFAFAVALGASFGAYALWPSRFDAGFTPAQPIEFSHRLHAGDMKIECLYCHSNADKGPHATVPPVATCMNCHSQVQPKDAEGKLRPDIAKLLDHWKEKKPIEWIKVNDVSDFVYFDHSRHVTNDVKCQECHGPVETMDRVRREHGLKMAFCLDCHRGEPLPGKKAIANAAVKSDAPSNLSAFPGTGTRAPTNCTTCHR